MSEQEILSKRLVEIRKKNGYTRKRLAEELGRPYRTITNYETGEHEPGHKYLIEISKKFGVTVDYLVGRSDTPQPEIKKSPSMPEEAKQVAEDYLSLDHWGKRVVRSVIDEEKARCEDESRFLAEAAPAEEPKVIHLYLNPSAAGYASPVFGQDYEPYTLGAEDPPGAEFAVRLQGNSMEPYFPDGSIVFCNRDPLNDGDIGVFYVDGGSVCKQYHKEGGVIYLFSLNRKRSDADVVLLPGGSRHFICQGRVITRQRFPIPGRG